MEHQLCALIYTISYGGLEHLWVLVSEGVLEPISPDTRGQFKFGGIQKLYVNFQLCRSQCVSPLHCST